MAEVVSRAVAALQAAVPHGYFVGGCVRDWLLGRPLKDLDVAVPVDASGAAEPEGGSRDVPAPGEPPISVTRPSPIAAQVQRVGRRVAAELGGSFFWLRELMAVGRVTVPGAAPLQIDLVPLAESLEANLRRRDFTLNAMGVSVREGLAPSAVIEDPTGGREDLAAGRLRLAAPDALQQDPLRCLRAFRFRATLGLDFAPGLETAIQAAAPGLEQVSGERIRDELFVLLEGDAAARVFAELLAHDLVAGWSTVLAASASGASAGSGSEQAARVSGVQLAGSLEQWLAARATRLPCAVDLTDTLMEMVTPPRRRRALALLAALSFHASAATGAIARALALSSDETRILGRAVGGAHGLMSAWPLPGRGRLLFWQQWEPGAVEAVLLSIAFLTAREESVHITRVGVSPVNGVDDRSADQTAAPEALLADLLSRRLRPQPPLLTGGEVMDLLRIPPGPEVGQVLQQIEECRADGLLSTSEEAREWLRQNPCHASALERRKR